MTEKHVLIIDDDEMVLKALCSRLEHEGLKVTVADSGLQGIELARKLKPDLILLDIMMPATDGYEVCKVIRMDRLTQSIPIIILTGKISKISQVIGFDIGADDYVTKPFDGAVLVARIKRLMEKGTAKAGADGNGSGVLKVGPLVADSEHHQVFVEKSEVTMTAQEFRILSFLMERTGKVVRRQELVNATCRNRDARSRTVDVHINKIRAKLGPKADFIHTIRGVGYCLKGSLS